jgi:hypothetical protein
VKVTARLRLRHEPDSDDPNANYPVLIKNPISLKLLISNPAKYYAKRNTFTDAAYEFEESNTGQLSSLNFSR